MSSLILGVEIDRYLWVMESETLGPSNTETSEWYNTEAGSFRLYSLKPGSYSVGFEICMKSATVFYHERNLTGPHASHT